MVTDSATTTSVLAALRRALEQSSQLGAIRDYRTQEIDKNTDANVDLPFIEIQPITEEQGDMARVDLVYDENGREIGDIFEWTTDLRVQIDIWTVSGSGVDVLKLGEELKLALFGYDTSGYDSLLPDETGEGIDAIDVTIGQGTTANTRGFSGGSAFLRRWRQTVFCTYTTRVSTVEEYGPAPFIDNILTPGPDDVTDIDRDGTLETSPPY